MSESSAEREPSHGLLTRQLLVVTGKGGVGKSAMTAALGHSLAARGRRTLVLEIDPRENLHQLLDVPPSGGAIVPVGERLFLQNLKPKDVVDWVVADRVPIGMVVRRIKQSAVYERFAEGAPGLKEVAILGHCLRAVRGEIEDAPRIDTVVLDAPATGHGIYLLTAARLFAEAIGEGPMATLAREAADFVAGEEAGVVVVTLAEELPVDESLELRQSLVDRFGRQPDLLIANGVYPPLPADDGSTAGAEPEGDPLLALWRRRRRVNEHELARLVERWKGPRVTVPLLPIDPGPTLVRALRGKVDDQLDQALASERAATEDGAMESA